MPVTPSNIFCPIAWLHRYTNEQGLHLLCCVGEGDSNVLRGADGKARLSNVATGEPTIPEVSVSDSVLAVGEHAVRQIIDRYRNNASTFILDRQ